MQGVKFFYRDPDAPSPNRPTTVGVVAMIEQAGRLLLELRADCGRWALIGGGVENGESLDEALRREVSEEMGLVVRGYALFGTFSDPSRLIQHPVGGTKRIITLAYRVEVEGFDSLRPSEESLDLRFFDPDELSTVDIVETHRHLVDRYLTAEPTVLD